MFNIIAQMTSTPNNLFSDSYSPILAALFIFGAAVLVFLLWLYYRLFEKAGQAGWKSLVPIYNVVIFLRLGGFSGWWILINFLPFFGQLIFVIIMLIAAYNITLNFNKPAWYVVIYLFFPLVWLLLLVFDKTAVWDPYAQGKIASSTTELPVQTPSPQQTPDVAVGSDGQVQPNQPQTPPTTPPVTSAPIQDVMPPSSSDENRQ